MANTYFDNMNCTGSTINITASDDITFGAGPGMFSTASTLDLNYPTIHSAGNIVITNTGTTTDSFWNSQVTDTIYTIDPNYSSGLDVHGDANIDGELTVKGVKLSERLDAIEQRLAILRPNQELESRWENLKALGEEYRRLEKDILAQEEIYNILKK